MALLEQADPDIDERFKGTGTLAVMLGIAVLGPAVFLLLPAFIGALADTYQLSDGELGLLGSADLIGLAIAAATGIIWVQKAKWRPVVFASLSIIVLGNVTSSLLTDFWALFSVRLMVGFASGALMAIFMSFAARTPDPNRTAALLIICQVSFMAVAFSLLPFVISEWGVDGIFVALAMLSSVLFLFVRLIPESVAPTVVSTQTYPKWSIKASLVLVSMSLFFIAQSGVWAFIEIIGREAQLTNLEVASALSLSTLFGLAGPLGAFFFGERFGLRMPIAISFFMQAIVLLYMALASYGYVAFLVCLSLFQVFWNLPLSYQFSTMVKNDLSGRLVVMVPTCQALGIALGPILFGLGMYATSAAIVPMIAVGVLVLYAACIIPVADGIQTPENSTS